MHNVPGAPRDGFLGAGSAIAFDSGGSSPQYVTQKTDTSPWGPQQDYLKTGFAQALNQLNSSKPQYYPGATYVPFSGQTEAALQGIENRATAGSPLVSTAQNLGLSQLQGNYLSPDSNPFIKATVEAAQRPVIQAFNENVVPSIDARFSASGRYGSGAHVDASRQAQDTLLRNLSDTAAQMYGQNYATERGIQQNTMAAAPGLAEADYSDLSKLASVGAAREGKAGEQLADQINRFNFEQNVDADKLARYMALIGGGSFGGSQVSQVPITSNPAVTNLGLGIGGVSSLASLLSALKGL